MTIFHKRGTFAILKFNNKVLDNAPFIQFSLVEPWLLPKHDNNETRNMWGWLFFYFGYVKGNNQGTYEAI